MLEKLSWFGRNWPGGMDTRRNLGALAFIFQVGTCWFLFPVGTNSDSEQNHLSVRHAGATPQMFVIQIRRIGVGFWKMEAVSENKAI